MIQQFIGETKSRKVIDEVHGIYLEEFTKQFPNYFEKNHSKLFSLVTVLEKDEIKNIGMSKIDDLLLDQWGLFFGSLLSNDAGRDMKNTGGLLRKPSMFSASNATFNQTGSGAVGTLINVGNGLSTPVRDDFVPIGILQSLVSGNGGWNSGLGKVDIPASAISTVNDTISQTALYGQWYCNTPVSGVNTFLLSYDLLSTPVPVSIGENINVDYQMVLS